MKEIRETKLVEQTTVRFVADDGKEFLNEKDCKRYERRLNEDAIERDYKKILIKGMEFPFQGWQGGFSVDLVKLNCYADYVTAMDYLDVCMGVEDFNCDEPKSYPCLKLIAYDEYYANFAYDNDITGLLKECEKAMTIIEKAMMEIE